MLISCPPPSTCPFQYFYHQSLAHCRCPVNLKYDNTSSCCLGLLALWLSDSMGLTNLMTQLCPYKSNILYKLRKITHFIQRTSTSQNKKEFTVLKNFIYREFWNFRQLSCKHDWNARPHHWCNKRTLLSVILLLITMCCIVSLTPSCRNPFPAPPWNTMSRKPNTNCSTLN
jgi:hypothetical protein